MNEMVKKKVNFIHVNLSQKEGLSPSCIALSFDGFDSIHGTVFIFGALLEFLRISNFFGLSTTEET
jgi:hypothetical protein